MRAIFLAGTMLLALIGCDKPTGAQAAAASPSASAGGALPYRAELAPGLDARILPRNADLEMVDLDPARYAAALCGYDLRPEHRPERCDLFARSDPGGTLIGYLVVRHARGGVWLDSALSLNERLASGPRGCGVSGKLSSSETGEALTRADAAGDFRARTGYGAWEKEPGNWLVVPDDGTDQALENPQAAFGMWYVERRGNNLRLTQERWNYCYRDPGITIDQVFRRVVTLRRAD